MDKATSEVPEVPAATRGQEPNIRTDTPVEREILPEPEEAEARETAVIIRTNGRADTASPESDEPEEAGEPPESDDESEAVLIARISRREPVEPDDTRYVRMELPSRGSPETMPRRYDET